MQKQFFRATNVFRFLGIVLLIASGFLSSPDLNIAGIVGQAFAVAGILLFCGPLLTELLRGNGTVRSDENFVSFFRFSNLLRIVGLVLLLLSVIITSPAVDFFGITGQALPLSGVIVLCWPTLSELFRAAKDRLFPRQQGGVP